MSRTIACFLAASLAAAPASADPYMSSTRYDADQSDFEQYLYDPDGNRIALRKRDGWTLIFNYDALNRVVSKIVPERAQLTAAQTRDVYYSYDLRGLQTRARFDSLEGEG